MRSKEQLKSEINTLLRAMTETSWNLRRMQKSNNWIEVSRVLHARHEIMKSIAHRQGLLIQVLEVEAEYGINKKEAA